MYYFFDLSSDPKTIGPNYPQMEIIDAGISDGLDEIAENKGMRVDLASKIFNLKMGARGKLTDAVSCSLGAGGDLMISDRLYKILQPVKSTSVQYFPLEFKVKKEIIRDYWWVHFTYGLEKYIDFKKTSYDPRPMKKAGINVPKTYDEYLQVMQTDAGKFNWLRMDTTVLLDSFPKEEELFMLCQANQKRYISAGVYDSMIKNKITGFDFSKATDLIIQ